MQVKRNIPAGTSALFAVRCTPDCPYEDCIIGMDNHPPIEMPGQGKGEKSDDISDSFSDPSLDSQSNPDTGAQPPLEQPPTAGKPPDPSDSPEPAQADSQDNPLPKDPAGQPDDRPGDTPKPPSDPQPKPGPQPGDKGQPKPPPSAQGDSPGTGIPGGQAQPEPQREVEAAPYSPVFEEGPHGFGASDTDGVAKRETPKKILNDSAFQSRLKSVMTDNAFDRRVKGRKRGRLDMKALHKVPTKVENIFTLKEARKNKRYNVVLLVDESGSMSGTKGKVAAECAVFLAQSFENININLAIIGFNKNISIRKDFNTKADYLKIYEAIATQNWGRGSGDNNDWDGLNRAYQMFKPGMEGENILIMLSDGSPASNEHGPPKFWNVKGKPETAPKDTDRLQHYQKDDITHLHYLVKAHDRRVKSIGIGIMQGGQQIPDHRIVDNVDELKPVILKKLGARIRRG